MRASDQQLESSENGEPAKRALRVRLVVFILIAVGVALILETIRRHRQERWLVSEVAAIGGVLHPPESIFQQLRRGRWKTLDDSFALELGGTMGLEKWHRPPAKADSTWLRNHEYFETVRIRRLYVGGTLLTGDELAPLIERHPISDFHAWELTGADDAAHALGKCLELRKVCLAGSDLTDEGFRALPLEQVLKLEIAHTHLTPAGLQELRRCRQLEFLHVDDIQADSTIAALLAANRPLQTLFLEGPQIMDAQLERLDTIQLHRLSLIDTSVSDDAIAELRKKLPTCDVMRAYWTTKRID